MALTLINSANSFVRFNDPEPAADCIWGNVNYCLPVYAQDDVWFQFVIQGEPDEIISMCTIDASEIEVSLVNECDDVYTVIQSGNTSDGDIEITGLTPSTCYIFAIASVCGEGDLSTYQTLQFTTASTGGEQCGLFVITFFGTTGYCDFVSCGGYVEHIDFTTSGSTMRCILLQPGTTTPVLFQSSAGVTILYHSTCG